MSAIESRINAAIDVEKPRQAFKTNLSIAFTALIGLVILGFFWIIRANPSVGSHIFAGDAGLQFITLFSLIIAIILFGLTEILQGRELSALLGGISGYILGRSARARDVPSSRASTSGEEEGAAGGAEGGSVEAGSEEGRNRR